MNKKHLALIGVIVIFIASLSVISIYVYMNTPANEFEQKLKSMPNVTFISVTPAQLNSSLVADTGQSQFYKTSETGFIQAVKSAEYDDYTSYIARIGNTFYFFSEGSPSVCYTP